MKGFRIIFNTFIVLILAVSILGIIIYANASSVIKSGGYLGPVIGNIGFVPISDGTGTPGVMTGDMAIIRKINTDSLNKGDVITYIGIGGKAGTGSILGVRSDSFLVEGGPDNPSDGYPILKDEILGKYLLRVPYLGYAMEYAVSKTGHAVCIAIFLAVVLITLVNIIIDRVHNLSKHKKKILRRKRRRNARYVTEGSFRVRRAVV